MSDSGEEVHGAHPPLPKDVISEVGGTKLFNKWCVMVIVEAGMDLIQSKVL
jgi:hypothetical protein